MKRARRPQGLARSVLVLALVHASAFDLSAYVKTSINGLGRVGRASAIFLEREVGGRVLPVPLPADAVNALEQTLSATTPAAEVARQTSSIFDRDGGLVDNFDWQTWASSSQAKRDAYRRCSSGFGVQREAFASPYHAVLDALHQDARASVSGVLIERSNLLGDVLVLGATVMLEPSSPAVAVAAASMAFEPLLCDCTVDEALGIALAATNGQVYVERCAFEAAAVSRHYSMQRGMMRITVPDRMPEDDGATSDEEQLASAVAAACLPWEVRTLDDLIAMPLEEKALSVLSAGLRLPRARDASDATLTALLEPFLDEDVRRQLRMRQALKEGDWDVATALEAATSTRGRLLSQLRRAVAEEHFAEAAELASQLRVETNRRMDVTQDEGAYDRYLDQDEWYARQLAAERERLLERDRQRRLKLDADGDGSGNMSDP